MIGMKKNLKIIDVLSFSLQGCQKPGTLEFDNLGFN